MSNTLSSAPMSIPCPSCGREIKKTVGYFKLHSDVGCTSCGARIALDNSEFRRNVNRADRELSKLNREVDKFNREMRRLARKFR
ncbi:hypothetical protein [Candidatus Filomicrobium marinum]|uniref:hypothetical protein n=1 Tax=Candidatus Filomicrobium marinum TaxID=1608628 RepID=UPI000AEE21A7|nr:hypothetical protein [Candidatus Filomicrobium marinum]